MFRTFLNSHSHSSYRNFFVLVFFFLFLSLLIYPCQNTVDFYFSNNSHIWPDMLDHLVPSITLTNETTFKVLMLYKFPCSPVVLCCFVLNVSYFPFSIPAPAPAAIGYKKLSRISVFKWISNGRKFTNLPSPSPLQFVTLLKH